MSFFCYTVVYIKPSFSSYVISSSNNRFTSNITKHQQFALNELNTNSNLVINKTDKGGKTVFIDKSIYTEPVANLPDDDPYIKINTNPCNSLLIKIKNVVKILYF